MEEWTTKNGDKMLIKDMTTQHIKNCIKAIEEERIQVGMLISDEDGIGGDFIDYSEDYIEAFERELEKRKMEQLKNNLCIECKRNIERVLEE